jgi:hypothetical protein
LIVIEAGCVAAAPSPRFVLAVAALARSDRLFALCRLAACAVAAAPAVSYAEAAVVAALPSATPFTFAQTIAPLEDSVQSPEIVCAAYPVPPALPTSTASSPLKIPPSES